MRVSPEASAAEHEGAVRDRLVARHAGCARQGRRSAGGGRLRSCGVRHGSFLGRKRRRAGAFSRCGGLLSWRAGHGHPRRAGATAVQAARSVTPAFGFDRAANLWLWGPHFYATRLDRGEIRTWHKAHRPGDGPKILRPEQGSDRFALYGQVLSAVLFRVRPTTKAIEEEEEVEEKEVDAEEERPRSSRSRRPTRTPRAATIFPRSRTRKMSISATTTTTPSSRRRKRKTTTSPTSSASATTTTRSERLAGACTMSRLPGCRRKSGAAKA